MAYPAGGKVRDNKHHSKVRVKGEKRRKYMNNHKHDLKVR